MFSSPVYEGILGIIASKGGHEYKSVRLFVIRIRIRKLEKATNICNFSDKATEITCICLPWMVPIEVGPRFISSNRAQYQAKKH